MHLDLAALSVGPIKPRMPRSEVRSVLGADYSVFRKTPFSKNTPDAFDKIHMHVFYDERDCVSGVELFRPASLILNNVEMIGVNCHETINFLKGLGANPIEDEMGFTAYNGIVSAYVPDKDKEFGKNYRDCIGLRPALLINSDLLV